MKRGTWVNSYTGRKIRPLNPYQEMFSLTDIAHHLSQICRFTGATKTPYSVAQHSVLVSLRAEDLAQKAGKSKRECREIAKWGLIHDASEAYLCDLANPVKRSPSYANYVRDEKRLMRAITKWLGLPTKEPAEVKQADREMLAIEVRDCLTSVHPDWYKECPELLAPFTNAEIEIWNHSMAKSLFISHAESLGFKCS